MLASFFCFLHCFGPLMVQFDPLHFERELL